MKNHLKTIYGKNIISRYCERHDSLYDYRNGKWLKKMDCKDPKCGYCRDKPKLLTIDYCKGCTCEVAPKIICRGMKMRSKRMSYNYKKDIEQWEAKYGKDVKYAPGANLPKMKNGKA
jgi:hypothetical protein